MHLLARAKINLALHVTGQRDDGYHLLDTLVTFADFGDSLHLQTSDRLTLTLAGPECGPLSGNADNIVVSAAEALRLRAGRADLGADITLQKHLPAASGIGGGSADAAATLLGLNKLWGLNLSLSELSEIGLQLGADIPMCLASTPSQVGGIGEKITPVKIRPLAMVLVNPRVELTTPAVFTALSDKQNAPLSPLQIDDEAQFDWPAYLSSQRNDLEIPALQLAPVVAACLNAVAQLDTCRLARMSGSGATCFGLFDNRIDALQAADQLRSTHPQWWVIDTGTVG